MSKQAELELLKRLQARLEAEIAEEELAKEASEPQGIWPVVTSGVGTLITESAEWVNQHYLYKTPEEAERIAYALRVFGEMNRHPLAAAPVDPVEQWAPIIGIGGKFCPAKREWLSYKLNFLYPSFATKADCEQAIADIGTDRLTLAARYWKGLTE
jgi:hypothetical protein